jgi:hypothetical protein
MTSGQGIKPGAKTHDKLMRVGLPSTSSGMRGHLMAIDVLVLLESESLCVGAMSRRKWLMST